MLITFLGGMPAAAVPQACERPETAILATLHAYEDPADTVVISNLSMRGGPALLRSFVLLRSWCRSSRRLQGGPDSLCRNSSLSHSSAICFTDPGIGRPDHVIETETPAGTRTRRIGLEVLLPDQLFVGPLYLQVHRDLPALHDDRPEPGVTPEVALAQFRHQDAAAGRGLGLRTRFVPGRLQGVGQSAGVRPEDRVVASALMLPTGMANTVNVCLPMASPSGVEPHTPPCSFRTKSRT